jgi:hypothetical protein
MPLTRTSCSSPMPTTRLSLCQPPWQQHTDRSHTCHLLVSLPLRVFPRMQTLLFPSSTVYQCQHFVAWAIAAGNRANSVGNTSVLDLFDFVPAHVANLLVLGSLDFPNTWQCWRCAAASKSNKCHVHFVPPIERVGIFMCCRFAMCSSAHGLCLDPGR